jgi:hypothetical protein
MKNKKKKGLVVNIAINYIHECLIQDVVMLCVTTATKRDISHPSARSNNMMTRSRTDFVTGVIR